MTQKPISGLYAITPDATDLEALLRQVEACLAGGAGVLQYRNKAADVPHREYAAEVRQCCKRHGVPFIVNDDIALALDVGADGVHLGRDDGDWTQARSALGPHRIIGVSCYGSLERALTAQDAGADYVAFGSVFPSTTKPHAPAVPLSRIAEARARLSVPIVAIGGIALHNAPQVIGAGADAVAVISAVFDAPDIREAAGQFSNLFKHDTSGKTS
jgi:thiamine-phosphate pyrophosphorylase